MFDGARAGVPRCVATSRGHKLVCGLIPYAVDPDAALNIYARKVEELFDRVVNKPPEPTQMNAIG